MFQYILQMFWFEFFYLNQVERVLKFKKIHTASCVFNLHPEYFAGLQMIQIVAV